ncbi:hypothetical protein LA303_06960 [Candidatus Sulfidibacterium hydrothermale]|uniref:hypothetical protein n=1 Tax=Candidatus Sulfidibacterium hydrothermale TaxID=2875962 RepID=UPI001F0A56DE|nr:hypothetical protein [Candidatus Sulfidibacterium hydrothermale]UBM61166.1 hypothetical protein LA303_06960 [Candidatus Sulfidibacterium hydrothermale]
MKRTTIFIVLIITLLFLFVYRILSPEFDTETFVAPNGKNYLTRIDYWSLKKRRTVFVYGKLVNKKIPNKKLEPLYNASLTGGFCLMMEWKNDTAVFYSASGEFKNDLPNKIKLIQLNGQNPKDMKRWFDIRNDTTGKYIEFHQKFVHLFSKHTEHK